MNWFRQLPLGQQITYSILAIVGLVTLVLYALGAGAMYYGPRMLAAMPPPATAPVIVLRTWTPTVTVTRTTTPTTTPTETPTETPTLPLPTPVVLTPLPTRTLPPTPTQLPTLPPPTWTPQPTATPDGTAAPGVTRSPQSPPGTAGR